MVIVAVGREDGQGEDVCGDEWQAVVRKEDVRATEKEKVVCGEGFRVGDIVRSVVVCDISVPSVFSTYELRLGKMGLAH